MSSGQVNGHFVTDFLSLFTVLGKGATTGPASSGRGLRRMDRRPLRESLGGAYPVAGVCKLGYRTGLSQVSSEASPSM